MRSPRFRDRPPSRTRTTLALGPLPSALGPLPGALGPLPCALDCDNPVRPHVQRQLLLEPFDERLSVLVQEPDERDRPLLRVAVGERQRAGALELAPQRLVLLLGGLNRLALKRFEIFLNLAQRV